MAGAHTAFPHLGPWCGLFGADACHTEALLTQMSDMLVGLLASSVKGSRDATDIHWPRAENNHVQPVLAWKPFVLRRKAVF